MKLTLSFAYVELRLYMKKISSLVIGIGLAVSLFGILLFGASMERALVLVAFCVAAGLSLLQR